MFGYRTHNREQGKSWFKGELRARCWGALVRWMDDLSLLDSMSRSLTTPADHVPPTQTFQRNQDSSSNLENTAILIH